MFELEQVIMPCLGRQTLTQINRAAAVTQGMQLRRSHVLTFFASLKPANLPAEARLAGLPVVPAHTPRKCRAEWQLAQAALFFRR
jgi:hypothetical protein